MKLRTDMTINGKLHRKGEPVPIGFIYPFFLLHMGMFGLSGFVMAYASEDIDVAFLYMHGGLAIVVYLVFYLAIFGLDEVRWMFINSALGLFGLWVVGNVIWHALHGTVPSWGTMSAVGVAALIANAACFALLHAWRDGDANMRSVWICSRNDAINNVLVIAAGLAVLWLGSGLPDLLVAFAMAALGIGGGWQIVRQSVHELRENQAPAV